MNKWKDGKGKEEEKREEGRRREGGGGGGEERGGGKNRLATFPLMGDVADAEDSLALARRQGHLWPWPQRDGSGAPCVPPQEPAQVGGLLAREEGQVQRVARHLQPGVQAQAARDCREAGDRGLWRELVGLREAKL